jgi:hypothetical protein
MRNTKKRARPPAQMKKPRADAPDWLGTRMPVLTARFVPAQVTPRPIPDDSAERKTYPIMSGFVDYFPAAMAEVAHVSYLGNQKHNPGEELHWSRGKSADHADCAMRHLIERGTRDGAGVRHLAQAAWRVMAALQLELEAEGAPLARGSIPKITATVK